MLIPGSHLLRLPIMSLQTGAQIAVTKAPLIDPGTLEIKAYRISHTSDSSRDYFIRINDIRELADVGLIVDSEDELVTYGDVISLDKVIDRNFTLVGKKVISRDRKNLGKVIDYTLDIDSFTVIQLTVKRPIIHSLGEIELLIHRSQIREINNKSIIVDAGAIDSEPVAAKISQSYSNPFRNTTPAPD